MTKPDNESWKLKGTAQDEQSITKDWQLVGQDLIDGVLVREVVNVQRTFGYLVELYRADWGLDEFGVDQVFQSIIEPGGLSAWHAHAVTTDRLFINFGRMRIALYDARDDSPTFGKVNTFIYGAHRPAIVVVPPRVWHGVQAVDQTGPSSLINIVDHAYLYDKPDHYRLPEDTNQIPFRFPQL